jgi:hypothetical protein
MAMEREILDFYLPGCRIRCANMSAGLLSFLPSAK